VFTFVQPFRPSFGGVDREQAGGLVELVVLATLFTTGR
jgi:hypothetical protein